MTRQGLCLKLRKVFEEHYKYAFPTQRLPSFSVRSQKKYLRLKVWNGYSPCLLLAHILVRDAKRIVDVHSLVFPFVEAAAPRCVLHDFQVYCDMCLNPHLYVFSDSFGERRIASRIVLALS